MKAFEVLKDELVKELLIKIDNEDWKSVKGIAERLEKATQGKALLYHTIKEIRRNS